MDITTILVGAIVLLLLLAWRHLTKNRGILESYGFPMDKPQGLLASPPHDIHNHLRHKVWKHWRKKLNANINSSPLLDTGVPG